MIRFLAAILMVTIAGCVPNTYYSITDDYVVGLRWFDRGMENNDIQAINYAIGYWEPLVAKGDCDAEYRMGLIYFMGVGKTQSFDDAYQLWLKAANGNQSRAQWALGDLYFQNEAEVFHHCGKTPDCNLESSLQEALFWYELADRGAKYSNDKKYLGHILPIVRQSLSEDDVREVGLRVAGWKPTPKDCGARSLW